MATQAALVPELHGEADDAVALVTEHGRDGRGIDSSGHGNGNGGRGHTLLVSHFLTAAVLFRGHARYADSTTLTKGRYLRTNGPKPSFGQQIQCRGEAEHHICGRRPRYLAPREASPGAG